MVYGEWRWQEGKGRFLGQNLKLQTVSPPEGYLVASVNLFSEERHIIMGSSFSDIISYITFCKAIKYFSDHNAKL